MSLKNNFYRITHWETWPYLLKYIPLAPIWGWYCLRARNPWFFTTSNPTLQFGGFEGETKMEMYAQLPPGSYPRTMLVDHTVNNNTLLELFSASDLHFPIAVKPDVGMMGFMFRVLNNEAELTQYHNVMPANYLMQQLVDYPLEVSVFYYRLPGSDSGHITGFIRKEFLQVTGDGKSTMEELIDQYPRATFIKNEVKAKHHSKLKLIPAAGHTCILSHALNLSRGGKLVSLEHEKDSRLLIVFDEISRHAKQFYYGRYDIKCNSIESLKNGESFSILEYNGCGAEPHHIYGNNNNLFQAYHIVLKHWKILYRISVLNHKAGIPYWPYKKGMAFLKAAKAHFKMLKTLDKNTPV